MSITLALVLAASQPPFPNTAASPDVAAILEVRARYGRAIEAKAPAEFATVLHPDFVQMASDGATIAGAQTVADSYAANEFSNPAFITYQRQTDAIEVSPNGKLAVERGHWRARIAGPSGETGNAGFYQAGWVKLDGGWRIRTESYVKLTCPDDADC